MNTCDTCKWWNRGDRRETRSCENPRLREYPVTGDDSCNLSSIDGMVTLYTGPRFGCIHWHELPVPEGKTNPQDGKEQTV